MLPDYCPTQYARIHFPNTDKNRFEQSEFGIIRQFSQKRTPLRQNPGGFLAKRFNLFLLLFG
jgi:hypothetical protein